MSRIRLVYKYFRHLLESKNTKGHGIHSPYLYRFTQNTIYEKNPFYVFQQIETLRNHLKNDNRWIEFKDFGTGFDREVQVKEIARKSLKRKGWAQLLFRIVNFTKAKNVLELGTSLGLTSAYLASPSADIQCVTLEGSNSVAEIAKENFEKLGLANIAIETGNIDDILVNVLAKIGTLDVVFIDANHQKENVLHYFEQCIKHIHAETVFILDDIYWSAEMEDAWKTIRKHEKVTATIDLFELGVVFFNKNFPQKTFKMVL